MNNRTAQAFLYSTGGIVIVFAILVAVNFIASRLHWRADLTQGRVYTLSAGTKAVLKSLPGPVKARLYVSKSDNAMPLALKPFARRVEDLLQEYREVSGGKLIIEKYDPQPDSDAEDSAGLDGVEPQMLRTGERFYLGLSIGQLDQKVSIPALSPNREPLLEYDITRALAQAARPTKPVIGIMSAFPMFGSAMPMPGQPPQPAWAFLEELRRDYTVKQIGLDVERIDPDIKTLVVAHPRDIKDSAQYAIDQFVLRGGKLIAFVDPYAYFDQANMRNPQMPMPGGTASTLDKLFTAWGVQLEAGKAVADLQYMRRGPQTLPALLFVPPEGLNQKDIVMSQVGNLLLPFAGAFTGKPADGLTQTVLIKSTKNAQLQDAMMSTQQVQGNRVDIKPTGVEYALAIKLSGKFNSAFNEKPKAQPKGEEEKKFEINKDKDAKADQPHIKQAQNENTVVLIADADLLADQASVEVQEVLGQRILVPRNGNLNLIQSLVELFSGDDNLINLRSRAVQARPLKVIQQMQAKAAQTYAGRINELERSLASTQQRIRDLQKTKAEGQQFILSPEQKAELDDFRKRQAETNRDLKQLRKTLRAETDSLETWTKAVNIGAVPLALSIIGLVSAWFKRRRVAAR